MKKSIFAIFGIVVILTAVGVYAATTPMFFSEKTTSPSTSVSAGGAPGFPDWGVTDGDVHRCNSAGGPSGSCSPEGATQCLTQGGGGCVWTCSGGSWTGPVSCGMYTTCTREGSGGACDTSGITWGLIR